MGALKTQGILNSEELCAMRVEKTSSLADFAHARANPSPRSPPCDDRPSHRRGVARQSARGQSRRRRRRRRTSMSPPSRPPAARPERGRCAPQRRLRRQTRQRKIAVAAPSLDRGRATLGAGMGSCGLTLQHLEIRHPTQTRPWVVRSSFRAIWEPAGLCGSCALQPGGARTRCAPPPP